MQVVQLSTASKTEQGTNGTAPMIILKPLSNVHRAEVSGTYHGQIGINEMHGQE